MHHFHVSTGYLSNTIINYTNNIRGILWVTTLTTDSSYRRLGDVNFGPATLCACADGEQHTILLTENHFI